MKILVDTHTHTVACVHAYSTIQENAAAAAKNGLKMIAVTDHGPGLEDVPKLGYFANLKVLPEIIEGVRILKGAEANILDSDGRIDLPEKYLEKLDFVLAGFHYPCFESINVEQNTNALVGALRNPYIDAISHPGNAKYPVNIEKVVLAAKEYGKFIEINDSSFRVRQGCEENCREFALLCKKHGVKIVCGSDAHYSEYVGKFDNVVKLLEDIEMPHELIMSLNPENFESYIAQKRNNNNRHF